MHSHLPLATVARRRCPHRERSFVSTTGRCSNSTRSMYQFDGRHWGAGGRSSGARAPAAGSAPGGHKARRGEAACGPWESAPRCIQAPPSLGSAPPFRSGFVFTTQQEQSVMTPPSAGTSSAAHTVPHPRDLSHTVHHSSKVRILLMLHVLTFQSAVTRLQVICRLNAWKFCFPQLFPKKI